MSSTNSSHDFNPNNLPISSVSISVGLWNTYKNLSDELSQCRDERDKLLEENKRLRTALEFYADETKYKEVQEPMKSLGWTPAQIAKEALAIGEKVGE